MARKALPLTEQEISPQRDRTIDILVLLLIGAMLVLLGVLVGALVLGRGQSCCSSGGPGIGAPQPRGVTHGLAWREVGAGASAAADGLDTATVILKKGADTVATTTTDADGYYFLSTTDVTGTFTVVVDDNDASTSACSSAPWTAPGTDYIRTLEIECP